MNSVAGGLRLESRQVIQGVSGEDMLKPRLVHGLSYQGGRDLDPSGRDEGQQRRGLC